MASTFSPPLEKHEFDGFACYCQTHAAPARKLPVVVFVGGLMQDVRAWQRCAKYLNQYTTVIAIDPPGAGFSPALPPQYDFDFISDAICSVLDAKGLGRVALGGASYGGVIAYRFAQLYPDRLHSLVLGGTFTQLLDAWRAKAVGHLDKIRNRRLDAVADEFVETLVCQDPTCFVTRQKLVRRVLTSTIMKMTGEQADQYVANIERVLVQPPADFATAPDVRSLLFTGEHDPFTSPQQMRRLAGGFHDAVFTTILDADHVSILERFDVVVQMIHRFFAGQSLLGLGGCTRPEYYGRVHQRDANAAA